MNAAEFSDLLSKLEACSVRKWARGEATIAAAAAADAGKVSLRDSADIVRSLLPMPESEKE